MSRESVSVALCTHNGERYIGRQVDSILNQTLPPRQLIVSDDASSDSTLEVIRRTHDAFRAARPDVDVELRILQNPVPLGVTANFEQAMRACSYGIIALSDQDDVWMPTRLERVVAVFESSADILLVHHDARLVDPSGAEVHPSLLDALMVPRAWRAAISAGGAFPLLLRRNLMTGATMCVRARLRDLAAPFPASWVHDEWLAIIAAAVGELRYLPDRLVDYRQHDGNQIGAAKLGVKGRFSRLVEPGAKRNERLLARAEALADRLPAIDAVDPSRVDAARRKLDHERMRYALSRRRPARIGPVLKEWRSGGYTEFGGGVADVARDLIQPR